jgi:hypothetical protein
LTWPPAAVKRSALRVSHLSVLVRVVVTPQPSTIACWRGPNDAIAATMSRSSRLYPLTAQIE